ncbi:hypothetical protein J4E93_006394 [Alternaria ventricosa]|uniref:uncharacterized protein n=1 Tax=Alternaria ventricosa TaxID=1187951 RepID=UPI0020C5536C|nr:uncharacterized protein J4E93_006394 [Alternaria ventricosa]KAI4644489.1 hypothetical protein J4E93_006394 [Alternaria ventricosa]
MPPSESPYVDVPLNLGRKNIRLVTLQPGDASESIKCDLQSHALDDECPAYVALSYAWGAKERYDDIHINGMSFTVGRNLWHFLHQMRVQRQDALFWIDAISIDQANVLEQNHQVQMMREIYTQACSVWIWLGEADDATMSDVAMQYLKTRVALDGNDVNPKKLWNARKAKAILGLCEKEYWKRIWIVQEVLLAREAKVLCGGHCVQWIKLQQLLADLQAISDRGRALHVVGVPAVLDSPAAVISRAKAQWNGDPQPLTLLLEQYHRQHSTDVRDKIYALHGLASDSSIIPIDYRIDPKELFVQIVQHACSSLAFGTDMKKLRRDLFGFANLMRGSLKVFCDEEELSDHISVAQWKSSHLCQRHLYYDRASKSSAAQALRTEGPYAAPQSLPQFIVNDTGERTCARCIGNRRRASQERRDIERGCLQYRLKELRDKQTHGDLELECIIDGCYDRFDHYKQVRHHVRHFHRNKLWSPDNQLRQP